MNLLHLARVSQSPVILAHVRASTGTAVSESNCHPFNAGRLSFMHNGSVEDFLKLKRELVNQLSNEAFLSIQGTTDSEHLFALFRDQVAGHAETEPLEALAAALEDTIDNLKRLAAKAGAEELFYLNIAVSDGQRAVVSRYATLTSAAPSLWYWKGEKYRCLDGVCQMLDGPRLETVIVSSEPLTADETWQEVPPQHLVLIDSDRRVKLRQVP